MYGTHRSGVGVLPTGVALRFTGQHQLPPPYSIRWIVQNEGDEARAAGQMDWQQDNAVSSAGPARRTAVTTAWCARSTRAASCWPRRCHRVRIRDEARRGFFRRR
ncbi:nucleotide-binding domain-containing protein [Azospirillum rugosum]|uniref:nucleotide-binding domain-containing protein n=1 Tax=Azospirillum rugosum TaxID=416170 RepID=UPI003611C81D